MNPDPEPWPRVTTYTYSYDDGHLTVVDDRAGPGQNSPPMPAEPSPQPRGYGKNPYADFNGSGTLLERYVHGPGVVNGAVVDQLLARTSSGGTTAWYLPDKLGSVRDIVSTSGTELDHVVYDSFGNIVTETNVSNGDRFKFAGMEYDSTTGQYYDRARDYASSMGRFLRQDPKGFLVGDVNLYRYVGNGPVNGVDPSGMDPQQGDPLARQHALEQVLLEWSWRRKKMDDLNATREFLNMQIREAEEERSHLQFESNMITALGALEARLFGALGPLGQLGGNALEVATNGYGRYLAYLIQRKQQEIQNARQKLQKINEEIQQEAAMIQRLRQAFLNNNQPQDPRPSGPYPTPPSPGLPGPPPNPQSGGSTPSPQSNGPYPSPQSGGPYPSPQSGGPYPN